jgi:(1->4)-alpha-D-glucan 1-alpha-D-glucosylmutase
MNDVIDQLLAQTAQTLADRRRPEATYRLQFHAGFTFADATRLVPYLHELGTSDCYASPYLKARPGSQHGYDIIDHHHLNPELGSEEDYAAFIGALQAHGMGQVLDTVPNHMAATDQNAWWRDVLENGPASPYAGYFDISWYASPRPELQGRILVPILGEPFVKALESQRLQLQFAAGAFTVHYFDHRFPITPDSFGLILGQSLEELERMLGSDSPALLDYQSILTAVKHLPSITATEPEHMAERQREKEVIKRRLDLLTTGNAAVREFIEQNCTMFNGRAGDPHSFDLLEGLLKQQAYRLAFWRVAADEINYRRFFDINDLAALSMEREEVFLATHELVLRLLGEGKVTGLRIDHPDGLFDPAQYLLRLQQHFLIACARTIFETRAEYQGMEWKEIEGRLREGVWAKVSEQAKAQCWPLYVVVEKILGRHEALPASWATDGTTGYDFLNLVNGLFVDGGNVEQFTKLYENWVHNHTPFAEVLYRRKMLILQTTLSSELEMLAYQLDRLAQQHRWSRDFTRHSLRQALREIIACFPVYRSYINGPDIGDADRRHVLQAVQRAMARNPTLSTALFQFLRDTLLLRSLEPEPSNGDYLAQQISFVGKFQQVTAPVIARGLEDTAFYVYNRLLSLNEVGGSPDRFGLAPAVLHGVFQERQARWPWALSATSTHDTKRSEDVRARLNVLSEMPDEWHESLVRWSRLNERHRITVDDALAPDTNEEYLLYQTLLGAWPLESPSCEGSPYLMLSPPGGGRGQGDGGQHPAQTLYADFVARIQAYMRKALHEAKVHTSWINPNLAYDEAVEQFIARILDPELNPTFIEELRTFQRRISYYGVLNSLSQTLLKLTAPGVADIYQGTELWDFSLVDPDNRRPVDYARRQRLLEELRARVERPGASLRELARELVASPEDGRVKLYVIWLALRCRRENPGLFTVAQYIPVSVAGTRSENVFAFMRQLPSIQALVAVPRLLTGLTEPGQPPCGLGVWHDTILQLAPAAASMQWQNLFTGEQLTSRSRAGQAALSMAQVFAHFPVALLVART